MSLPLDEMRQIGRHFGATLNDVAATVVDAGLHAYLREADAAFPHRLVATCPVSLRAEGEGTVGTRVSSMFVRLGEPEATPAQRIRQVVESMAAAKEELAGMSTAGAMTFATGVAGLAGLSSLTHLDRVTPPVCNLAISNVPGARETRYLNGARLLGLYPVPGLAGSIGLNVTLSSYDEHMDFGFMAYTSAIGDVAALADHTLRRLPRAQGRRRNRLARQGTSVAQTQGPNALVIATARGRSISVTQRRVGGPGDEQADRAARSLVAAVRDAGRHDPRRRDDAVQEAAGHTAVVREIVEAYRAFRPTPPFNFMPELVGHGAPHFREVDDWDPYYHVGHLSLPAGSSYQDLLRLVADLHEPMLDRDRLLFRCWIIDGVPGGRFAIYTKTHHSVVDGVSGLRMLYQGLSSVDERRVPEPAFALPPAPRTPPEPTPLLNKVTDIVRNLVSQAGRSTRYRWGCFARR